MSDRVISMDGARSWPPPWSLEVYLDGHGPVPFVPGVYSHVQLSWDDGQNWWDGKAQVADWTEDHIGQRFSLSGTWRIVVGRDPDNPRRPNPGL